MSNYYGFEFEDPRFRATMPEPKNVRGGHRKGCMKSGMWCIRTTLILLNLAVGLVGVCIIAVGAMLLSPSLQMSTSHIQENDVNSNIDFSHVALFCIIFGGLVTSITFCGCFGACVKSRCLLLTYLATVITVVMLQLFVSVFAIFKHERMINFLKDEVKPTLERKSEMDNSTMSTWDLIQTTFQCCGVDSFANWFESGDPEGQTVPDSCCLEVQKGCGKIKDPSTWNEMGCLVKFEHFFTGDHLFIVACVIVGIVFIQLYGVITSLLLSSHIRTPKTSHPFHEYRYERANNKGPTF